MSNEMELFRLDLRIHRKVISLKIYERDTLGQVIQRICQSIGNSKDKDKLKQKLLKSITATLQNQKIQPKIRDKLRNLIESDNVVIVDLQSLTSRQEQTQTPFKLLQSNTLSSKDKKQSKSKKHFNYLQQAQEPNLKLVVNYKNISNDYQATTTEFNEDRSYLSHKNSKSFVRSSECPTLPPSTSISKDQRRENQKSKDNSQLESRRGFDYSKIGSQRRNICQQLIGNKDRQQLKHQSYYIDDSSNKVANFSRDYEKVQLKSRYELAQPSRPNIGNRHSRDRIQNYLYERRYEQAGLYNQNVRKGEGSQTFGQYKLNRNKSQSLVANCERQKRSDKDSREVLRQQKRSNMNLIQPQKGTLQKYSYDTLFSQPENRNYVGSIKRISKKYSYLLGENAC